MINVKFSIQLSSCGMFMGELMNLGLNLKAVRFSQPTMTQLFKECLINTELTQMPLIIAST